MVDVKMDGSTGRFGFEPWFKHFRMRPHPVYLYIYSRQGRFKSGAIFSTKGHYCKLLVLGRKKNKFRPFILYFLH